MADQEFLSKVRVGVDTVGSSIEVGTGTDIQFVRVLPIDLASLPADEDHFAVELLNTMGYALSVAGWMAHNWERAAGLPFEDHQEASQKINGIFTDIAQLYDLVYDPQLEEYASDIRSWMLQEAGETGRLPETAREVIEFVQKIDMAVILGEGITPELKEEYKTLVWYIAARRTEQINANITAVLRKEDTRFPETFFDFIASTDEKTLDAKKTSLASIAHINHDAAKMLGMIAYADRRREGGLSLSEYVTQSWSALYRFIAHEARGYTEGIAYEMMSPSLIRDAMQHVLEVNSIAGVHGELDFDNKEIYNKPILWAPEDIANLMRNYLHNAAELLGDINSARRGADKTFDFTVRLEMADELPYDAPEGREDEGQGWLKLVIDDNGPGIGEHVAGILGEKVFLCGEHGYQNGQDSHGDGMAPQQRNIEARGGVMIVRNRVKDPLFEVDYTRDSNDTREVIGARIEVYLPFSAKF